MKHKYTKYIIIYYIFFIVYWLYIYRNLDYRVSSIETLHILTTATAGYGNVNLLGTVYALMFIILLYNSTKLFNVQYLLRVGRRSYIKEILILNMKTALSFSFIFISTSLFFITLFQDFKLLIDSKYFIGVIISFFIYTMYYSFVGLIFIFFDIILSSKNIAIIVTFAISLLLTILYIVYKIPTPIKDLLIFDRIINGSLSTIYLISIILKFCILSILISVMTLEIFKVKDVLFNEN